jgi:hypothetical protein
VTWVVESRTTEVIASPVVPVETAKSVAPTAALNTEVVVTTTEGLVAPFVMVVAVAITGAGIATVTELLFAPASGSKADASA